jgi:uridine kinase
MKKFSDLNKLAEEIRQRAKKTAPYVIAISGFVGSGKSTLSEQLKKLLADATVIHVDDFIAADENGAKEGYLHNWEKLKKLVFERVKTDEEIVSRIYDWPTNKQVLEKLPVTKYMIIEGSAGLIQDKFLAYIDLTIWIDVPHKIANARGKRRDKEEYNVDHDELWDNVWTPREKESFKKQRPDKKADIIFDNQ